MRRWIGVVLTCFCWGTWFFSSEAAPPFKADQYTELELKVLQTQPESYKNKKVCYESRFNKVMTTFPAYAERNGFKAGKYYCFLIPPLNLPVVVKKTDEMNALAVALKRGTVVKVYGKIRKFKLAPKAAMMPHYYLELVHLEVLSEPKDDASTGSGEDAGGSDRKPRPPLLPRRRK